VSVQPDPDTHQTVSAQAPATVAVATKVGQPTEHGHTPVLQLNMAISRYDIATIEPRDDKEILVSYEDVTGTVIGYDNIPEEDLVIVFKAVDVLRDYLIRPKDTSGVDITIQKNIPFDTHLGGRGASAAAVLVALAALWEANISRDDLIRVAHRVDSSVAESITGGALMIRASSTEVILTQVLTHHELAIVIVPAAADIRPAELTQTLHKLRQAQHYDAPEGLEFDAALLDALAQGDAEQVALLMHNDFQPALVQELPDHNDWLTAGMAEGALAVQTIGPGPSLLFVARDMQDATEIAERFEERMEIAAVAEYGPVAGAHLL